VPFGEAVRRGLVDRDTGCYINSVTGERCGLRDITLTTCCCCDWFQQLRRPVPFGEAVRRGLVDRDTGCYINSVTGERCGLM